MVNIRKLRGEDSIRVHCNSEVNILDRVGNLPGYVTVWYEPTGIANILLILKVTKKFQVVLTAREGIFLGCSSWIGK